MLLLPIRSGRCRALLAPSGSLRPAAAGAGAHFWMGSFRGARWPAAPSFTIGPHLVSLLLFLSFLVPSGWGLCLGPHSPCGPRPGPRLGALFTQQGVTQYFLRAGEQAAAATQHLWGTLRSFVRSKQTLVRTDNCLNYIYGGRVVYCWEKHPFATCISISAARGPNCNSVAEASLLIKGRSLHASLPSQRPVRPLPAGCVSVASACGDHYGERHF